MKKKTLALLLSLVLVIGVAAGGTLAWLLDETDPVVNTFTDSDINIELTEATGKTTTEEGKVEYNFKMIPGWTIAKDPLVTVKKGSEDCYVFVKVEKSTNFGSYMTYTIDSAWKQLTQDDTDKTPVTDVYYQEVTGLTAADATDWTDYVLAGEGTGDFKNGCVKVNSGVTKSDMATAKTNPPTLTFTAYATQKWQSNSTAFTPYEAWTKVAPVAPTPAPTPSGP